MKTKIIAITNQKGGVGKSTTAAALTAGLTLKKFKVLAIDLDPQGNLTHTSSAVTKGATVLGVLTGDVKAAAAIQHTDTGDIIAANRGLAGADAFIIDTGKEYCLKEALEEISENYDYIVIDTPPSLGILTVNALTAADKIVIPAQCDIYSLTGIEQLSDTIKPVKKYCNKNLKLEGILLTRYNARTTLTKEVAELAGQLALKLGTKLFKSTIREAVVVKEAQISQMSLFAYSPKSKAAEDYGLFVDEIINNGDE